MNSVHCYVNIYVSDVVENPPKRLIVVIRWENLAFHFGIKSIINAGENLLTELMFMTLLKDD